MKKMIPSNHKINVSMRSSKASPPFPPLDLQKKIKDKKEHVTDNQKITKKISICMRIYG
jgi:hypothetical protein